MVEMAVVYTGGKHCELRHGPSGSQIETDAPKDNCGKGERFSPTDLMGASLASCILTTMAIHAEREGHALEGAKARVLKEMNPSPRKISRLPVEVTMPKGIPPESRAKLEAIANQCPVKLSLHPDIEAPIQFVYLD